MQLGFGLDMRGFDPGWFLPPSWFQHHRWRLLLARDGEGQVSELKSVVRVLYDQTVVCHSCVNFLCHSIQKLLHRCRARVGAGIIYIYICNVYGETDY